MTNRQDWRFGLTAGTPEGARPGMAGITIKELAEKEGVEKSYLAKLLKLNILAPAIVETILPAREAARTASA